MHDDETGILAVRVFLWGDRNPPRDAVTTVLELLHPSLELSARAAGRGILDFGHRPIISGGDGFSPLSGASAGTVTGEEGRSVHRAPQEHNPVARPAGSI
ncbi:hypothetical protein RSA3_12240 [Microbacterium testaceum]|uniref:Uncharacterized protein n=1 Tax=Microbacterium testaceum TaxID=2033 RepID=A0A147F5R3_MICTE|nr:hypothetical protein NS283_04520 [Microbacterium testaceum]KTS09903.1 hypothetical protein RSA3_12240 [Microbacterium testaceum]